MFYQCDEEKPKCRSCNRRATPCTYANRDGLDQLATAADAASSPFDIPDPRFRPPSNQPTYGQSPRHGDHAHANGLLGTVPSPLSLNMAHLELLLHFITVTADALSLGAVPRDIMHTIVPRIALSHEFLMHSVLAVSALHIAHLQSEQRPLYSKRASAHLDRALQLQPIAMAHPSPENGDALFAFSLLIIYSAFAAPMMYESPNVDIPLYGVAQCINLFRGIRQIGPTVIQWVEKGPLAPLLLFDPNNIKTHSVFQDQSTEDHFSKLVLFCSIVADFGKETEDIESFAAAASLLRASFLKFESVPEGELKTPPVWLWATRLPASFVERLKERHIVPLVLVAHWCVLLSQIQQYWWIQNWVGETMDEITQCIPHDYLEWLDWPLMKMSRRAVKAG